LSDQLNLLLHILYLFFSDFHHISSIPEFLIKTKRTHKLSE